VTTITPKGDALRHAIAWLVEQGPWTPERVDAASQRFDLSPIDEDFLLREARRLHPQDPPPPTDAG
jgi:hypothetical protein